MLTLVEFQMLNKMTNNFCRLEYLPNWTAAQLLACLRAENFEVRLVKGQTRYFKDVFINEKEEIFELLSQLDKKDIDGVERGGYNNLGLIKNLLNKDQNEFSTTLKEAYRIATGQSERDYLDKEKLLNLVKIKNGIFELYDFYYNKKKKRDLSIINNLFESIKRTKPDIVEFSLTSNYDYAHIEYLSDYVAEVINRIKKELEIPVIASGQLMPTLENLEEYVFKHLNLDYFIFDEGIIGLPLLLKRIYEEKSVNDILNIGYKKGQKIKRNLQKYSIDFNLLPPPEFSDFDLDLYFFPERMLPLHVATTCSWQKCVFCEDIAPRLQQGIMGEKKFLEIINRYRNDFKANFVEIQSISPSPDQIQNYMNLLVREGIDDVYFAMLSRLEEVYSTKKAAQILNKGGMRYIMWGLESGCQKTLDRMRKGTRIETIENILKNFYACGIKNMCYVIAGFPGETKQEFNTTVDFLQKNHKYVDGAIIIPFSLFKNSYIAKHKEDFFIKSISPNPDNPATYSFETTKGLCRSHEDSKNVLKELRYKIDSGRIKISNKNMDPIDQSYLEKIKGLDAFHHILFYLACKKN